MTRASGTSASHSTRILPAAILALLVVSCVPLRWLGWASWFAGVARTVIAPLSHPISRAAGAIVPRTGRPEQEAVETLQAERDLALLMASQLRAEVERLKKLNADLQSGIDLNPALDAQQVSVPVIGRSSDLTSPRLIVRAGTRAGVTPLSTVATVEGVQLLGRVRSAQARLAEVQTITDRTAGSIEGVVVGPSGELGPRCLLTPAGDGTLRGRLEDLRPEPGREVVKAEVGVLVRLRDASWPASAQMLELGRIESIEPLPDQPLRLMVVVRPRVTLERVTELVLRVVKGSEEAR